MMGRILPFCVIAISALGVLAFGILKGTFAASDTDPYGYVSQADLISSGSLRLEHALVKDAQWRDAGSSFVPPGYALAADRQLAVPTYSTGLPLAMAVLRRATGRRDAVFYAVPILGAIAVLMTALLGTRLHSPMAGALASVLMATSPSFLYQIVQPVSDLPAAAWWTCALALAAGAGSGWASGLAAGMAVLTRPNLFPLALFIGAFLARRAMRGDDERRLVARRRLFAFVAGAAPGFLAVAALNQHWFGSPFRSGYGRIDQLYAWTHVLENLDRYPRWLMQTQTPLVCLAFLAPLFARRATARQNARRAGLDQVWLLIAVVGFVSLSYLFWGAFGREEWWYLRFLLPAYPPLIVLSVCVLLDLFGLVAPSRAAFVALAMLTVTVWTAWQLREAGRGGAFALQQLERRYVDVAYYIRTVMPREAVFVAGLHAGSIRYHADRITLNFARLDPGALDASVAELTAKGYRPHFALEEGEEPAFRARFGAANSLGRLDWPPMLYTSSGVQVHVFNPADRQRFMAGEAIGASDLLFKGKPILTTKDKS
jgi:hypothetical protein